MKHYQFGGSTAKRTEHCQAWITLSEGIPNIESEAASTGTNIHLMLEQANLDIQLDFNVHLDTVCPETGKVIDADQVELAKDIWDVDHALCAAYDVEEWEA